MDALRFRSLALKNPTIRASADSSSLDWEIRFAQAGVGAIISPCVAAPRDDALCAWQEHIGRIHAYRCKYIVQIGQPDSTPARAGTALAGIVGAFAEAARWARETGADGLEIQAPRAPLSAQLLGPGADDPLGWCQGSLRSPASLLRDVVQAVRGWVGWDLHVQVRLSVNSLLRMMAEGTLQLIQWLEEHGIDAVHLVDEGPQLAGAVEGAEAIAARFVRDAARIPVLRNGRFHTPEDILGALNDGSCDGVTLTRPLAKCSTGAESASRRVRNAPQPHVRTDRGAPPQQGTTRAWPRWPMR